MQNNEQSNSHPIRKFFQEKGYYIVLFLCICAVGISGYLFVSNAISEKNSAAEQTLSVATSATVPSEAVSGSENAKAGSSKTAQRPAESEPAAAKPAQPNVKEETPEVSSLDADEKVHAAASSIRVWPLSGEQLIGYSADHLSYNATTQDWRTHDGVDLLATSGEPVRASCAGTVTAVYDDDYLGTTIVISHAGGYTTQYSNLTAMPTVSAGSEVAAGDIIGAVGETAILEIADQPHLHFAVTQNGESIDPNEFVD